MRSPNIYGDTMLRLPSTIGRMGRSRSSIYKDIARGVFPKPIKLGPRSIGWPEIEVDAIVNARIAGLEEDEIRGLVELLEKGRSPLRTRDEDEIRGLVELVVKDRSTLRTR
jgi:prophage regulatory protein